MESDLSIFKRLNKRIQIFEQKARGLSEGVRASGQQPCMPWDPSPSCWSPSPSASAAIPSALVLTQERDDAGRPEHGDRQDLEQGLRSLICQMQATVCDAPPASSSVTFILFPRIHEVSGIPGPPQPVPRDAPGAALLGRQVRTTRCSSDFTALEMGFSDRGLCRTVSSQYLLYFHTILK